MPSTDAISPLRPINPIELPTGNRVMDKFDKLFRRLFDNAESISIDAEKTLPGLKNDSWDGIWYAKVNPYLIGVAIIKSDDGSPVVEVSLSKKKAGDGLQYANFTRRELDLLCNYEVGVFDHNTHKSSHLVQLKRDECNPRFEIPLSFCDQVLDLSVVLPAHRQTSQALPHSFSIFINKEVKQGS